MQISHAQRRITTALAGGLALAVVATTAMTAPAAAATFSQAQVSGSCTVAPGSWDETRLDGPASFNHPRQDEDLSAVADPVGQIAGAHGTARWETTEPLGDSCKSKAGFLNTLTVAPGTTGLAHGTPVTLLARVRFAADADEQTDPAVAHSTSWNVVGRYAVVDQNGPSQLVDWWAAAARGVRATAGSSWDPDGDISASGYWVWSMSSNGGPHQGEQGGLDGPVCDALPCTDPAGVEPFQHPMGTRTIAFTTTVGAELYVQGDLEVTLEASDAAVSATVDATDGLHAAVLPGEGFEGLDLQLNGAAPDPVDTVAPVATLTADSAPTASGWYAGDAPLTVSATDGTGSGIKSVTTQLGAAAPVVTNGATAPLDVTAEGTTTVTAWATDVAGNTSAPVTHTVRIDRTAPVLTVPGEVTAAAGPVSYEVTATDALDAAPASSCTPASGSTFGPGRTTVSCTATDHAGNTASASFDVVVPQVVDTTAAQRVLDLRASLLAMHLHRGTEHRLLTAVKQLGSTLADPVESCLRVDKLARSVVSAKLTPAQKSELLTAADEIGALLGC